MGERSIPDRLGEALRVQSLGLIRPLWEDLPEARKDLWRSDAKKLLVRMSRRGLKVVVEEGYTDDE